MKTEFIELLNDVKEQILYLQELGVDNLDFELSENFLNLQNHEGESGSRAVFQNTNQERLERFAAAGKENIERFVPTKTEFAKLTEAKTITSDPQNQPPDSAKSDDDFESAKISRLPSLAGRKKLISQNNPQEFSKPSPPNGKIEEIPQDSLFGDFRQTLPESNETLEDIRADIGNCTRCPLWQGRTKIVHSTGNLNADLMFVGEAPGADEDAQGVPFIGRAGQLLNKIIEAIGMKREDVFVGNINRCRPPGNRAPTLPEANTCKPFLLREIAVVRPKAIVVLGNTACQNLLETKTGISRIRGEFQDYYGVKVMPTFHPAYLLRDPTKKREVWEDMKKVREELNKLK